VQLLRDLEVPLLEIPSLPNANSVDRLVKADETGVLLSAGDQARAFGAGWDPSWQAAARARL